MLSQQCLFFTIYSGLMVHKPFFHHLTGLANILLLTFLACDQVDDIFRGTGVASRYGIDFVFFVAGKCISVVNESAQFTF